MSENGNIEKPLKGIVAHRGDPMRYPENALAGYKSALNMAMLYPNVKMFLEADIHATQDRTCVAIHDDSTNRTTKFRANIGAMSWEQAQLLTLRYDLLQRTTQRRTFRHIDFARRAAEQGKHDMPLHSITRACDERCGDERIPAIKELLELIWQTNQYRLSEGGTPVGIILDLKSVPALPILAETLNQFAETHYIPGHLPLLALGLSNYLSQEEMNKDLWDNLSPEAKRYFDNPPLQQDDADRYVIRRAQIKPIATPHMLQAGTSVIVTSTLAALSKWSVIGDPDPSVDYSPLGLSERSLVMNFPGVNDTTSILAALQKQDLVLTDNAWLGIRLADAWQKGDPKLGRYSYFDALKTGRDTQR